MKPLTLVVDRAVNMKPLTLVVDRAVNIKPLTLVVDRAVNMKPLTLVGDSPINMKSFSLAEDYRTNERRDTTETGFTCGRMAEPVGPFSAPHFEDGGFRRQQSRQGHLI